MLEDPGQKRLPELDGLRGIAIAAVVLYHYFYHDVTLAYSGLFHWLHRSLAVGWAGVDLFFVLSGFLLGGILLDHRASRNYFSTFYARRAFRILPLYAVTLAVFYGLLKVYPDLMSGWLENGRAVPPLAYFLFLQNFWMARLNDLGAVFLGPTWSLAIEEQFYLCLAPLVRWSGRWLPAILLAGIISAPLLRHAAWVWGYPLGSLVLLPCRWDALLMGVGAAWLVRFAPGVLTAPRLRAAALAAGAVILVYWRYAPSQLKYPMSFMGFSVNALFFTSMMLLALKSRDGAVAALTRQPWLKWLGIRAYCIYLAHQPVRGVIWFLSGRRGAVDLRGPDDIGVMIVAIAATLLLSQISWVFFEEKFLKIGKRRRYGVSAVGRA